MTPGATVTDASWTIDRYRRLYEHCAVAIFELDLEGRLISANPAMVKLFGYETEAEFLEANENGALFVDPAARVGWFKKLQQAGRLAGHRKSMLTRTGCRIELQDTTQLVYDEVGDPVAYQGTATDVSEVVALTRRLSHDAYHDALTRLPNRKALERSLRRLIDSTRAKQGTHALCYFDLDQFRVINDTLGHGVGDEMLRQLGAELASRVGERDTLARIGGDQFALLLRNRTPQQAAEIANDLLNIARDFRISSQGNSVGVTVSVGVALIDDSTTSVSDVLGAADAACYTAKEKGRNRVHIQESNDKTVSRRISEMRSAIELKHALQEGRLSLFHQPIIPLRKDLGSEERFELLVRMTDSEGRLVHPGKFLPAAEKYHLSTQVDHWVIESFLEWLMKRPSTAPSLGYGAVNLSGLTLGNEEFLQTVCDAMDRLQIPGRQICFEITETAAISNLGLAQEFIATLRERGCHFALDDFGSGVSSFGYLRHLPVDLIKIDGMFVRMLKSNLTDRTIVKSISEVAHSLGLMTIAEFVEDQETAEILTDLGIDYAQGYALGRPAPLLDAHGDEEPRDVSVRKRVGSRR